MKQKPGQLDFDGIDLDAIDLTIDLECLDAILGFDLDGIGLDFDGVEFLPSMNARGGVLHGSPEKCGAMTRKGTPCRARALAGKGRCKFHGGLSTGPKTPEGRERIAEAQRLRWAKWRAAKQDGGGL